jgi:hypothetical protein
VRVSSPALIGGERVVRTAENGNYRVPLLAPGRYRIVVEASGLSSIVGSETLELGKTTTLNWKFAAVSSATVEVFASASSDVATVGMTQNYSTEALATLPVDRSMEGIMNLTPGVNGKAAWGGSTSENAWLMDGMNIGDVSGGGQWLYANPDWFSEVQVGGIGANAEYGNFNGGYTNALVKRGGNDFEGSFNVYYSDSKWEAKTTNPNVIDRSVLPGKSYDAALNVGGPIIKDKLWFFASAWARQTQTTPIGALDTVKRSYQNFLAKFTWQATPNATLETLLEYDSLPETNKGMDNTVLPIASHNQVAPDRLFNVIWTQTLNSSMVLTAKVSGYSGNYEGRPNNGDQPSLNTEGSLTTLFGGSGPTTLDYFGNNQWYRNNYRARIEGALTLDYFKTSLLTPGDSHAFRFGFEQAQASNEDLKRPTGGVQFYAFEGDTPGLVTPDVFDIGGGYDIKMHSNRTAMYLQDTWTVNDRLTLNPGIRFERYTARGYGQTSNIWDKNTIAPRFGGSLALTADLKNVLRFHWGKYYTAFSSWFVDRAYQQWTPKMTEYWWYGPDFNPLTTPPSQYPPAVLDPAEIVSVTNNISPVDPNAKQPFTEETTLSFEHKFDGPWSISATWVYRQQKDILVRKDMADQPPGPNATGSWNTSAAWYTYHGVDHDLTWWNTSVDPSNPNGNNWLVTTEPTAKRNYVAASLMIERKWMNDWSLNASFTRARRYGNVADSDGYDSWAPYESPNYLVNAYGLLPGYNDYEGKVRGTVKLPWDMKLAMNFTYLSGQRYTPYVRTDWPDAGSRSYVFIEPRGSEKYPSEHLLDMRLSKDIKFAKKANLELFGQVFNVLNTGTTLSYSSERVGSSAFGVPSSVEQGRRVQLGLRLNF